MSSILRVYKYKPAILYYVVVVIVDISVCHILVFIYLTVHTSQSINTVKSRYNSNDKSKVSSVNNSKEKISNRINCLT